MATKERSQDEQLDGDLLRQRVCDLEQEGVRLRAEVQRLEAENQLQKKALRACLPEACSVQEAAEWVDILQEYHDGKLIPVDDLMAELDRLESSDGDRAA